MNINFNKYFNLSSLNEEQQVLFINSMINLVMVRLSDIIGDHLTEQEITDLESVSKTGDSQTLFKWLNEHIPNLGQAIDEILSEESRSVAVKLSAMADFALAE